MTISERHEIILGQLNAKGSLSVTELSTMLNVSEVTIRKDLTLQGDEAFVRSGQGARGRRVERSERRGGLHP